MTDKLNKIRDEMADIYVFECPKYSGYPEHIKTFGAGFDAACAHLLPVIEKLKLEIDRLRRVIAQELSENDDLGAEYTYVNALRTEVERLTVEIMKLKEEKC